VLLSKLAARHSLRLVHPPISRVLATRALLPCGCVGRGAYIYFEIYIFPLLFDAAMYIYKIGAPAKLKAGHSSLVSLRGIGIGLVSILFAVVAVKYCDGGSFFCIVVCSGAMSVVLCLVMLIKIVDDEALVIITGHGSSLLSIRAFDCSLAAYRCDSLYCCKRKFCVQATIACVLLGISLHQAIR
jgi:hypothetical protein